MTDFLIRSGPREILRNHWGTVSSGLRPCMTTFFIAPYGTRLIGPGYF